MMAVEQLLATLDQAEGAWRSNEAINCGFY